MGKKKKNKANKATKTLLNMPKAQSIFYRQFQQIDMFEDASKKVPPLPERQVEWEIATNRSPSHDLTDPDEIMKPVPQGKSSILSNAVLIGPRNMLQSRNRSNNESVKPTIRVSTTTSLNENTTRTFEANEPKFELNAVPVEKIHQEQNFEYNHSAMNFNQSQPMDFVNNQGMIQSQQHTQTGYTGVKYSLPKDFVYPKGIPKSMVLAQLQEMQAAQMNQPSPVKQDSGPKWILNDVNENWSPDQSRMSVDQPVYIDTSTKALASQVYSPSEDYEDNQLDLTADDSESANKSDAPRAGQKRVSAFQRLGPQTQPKTPKITINVNMENEKPVREVVDLTDVYDDDKYTPVHLRPAVINSTDETVMKYLVYWPWKKDMHIRRTVGARSSKSVMLMEQEKMEELYERDSSYFVVEVKGYPASWNQNDVLDVVLESVKGKSFIPCFTDFTKRKCCFLVMKCKSALLEIHRNGFIARRDDVELRLYISAIYMSLTHIDFIPRLILRKRLMMAYYEENKLDLSEFTLKEDINPFIYFPLNRLSNQAELIELNTITTWNCLTDLNLSRNRLTSISGFNLSTVTPNLKHLDLSQNLLNRVTALLVCRDLPLNSLNLEGNPLCQDYIDKDHYVKVIKMMFPCIKVIDGTRLHIPGSLPEFKKHYCTDSARPVVDTFLEIFFPLLDSGDEQRSNIERLYDARAVMTITYNSNLRCKPVYRSFRNMFLWARVVEDGNLDSLEGILAIMKLVNKWPEMEHDPYMFNVDVLFHNDTTTILRVSGILKLIAKTLADDEYLLAFTRTFVLKTNDGAEYKIYNDMVYWNEPSKEYAKRAFQVNTLKSLKLSLKLESPPDKELKEKLMKIFMKLTDQDREISERCLEEKNWHFREALEFFAKVLKLDNLHTLRNK